MAVFITISGKNKVNEQLNVIFFSPLFVQNPSTHYSILCASSILPGLNCGTKSKSFLYSTENSMTSCFSSNWDRFGTTRVYGT